MKLCGVILSWVAGYAVGQAPVHLDPVVEVYLPSGRSTCTAFAPDSQFLACGGGEAGDVVFVDLDTGAVPRTSVVPQNERTRVRSFGLAIRGGQRGAGLFDLLG